MLQSLHIENIAVIKRTDIDFSKGFTVLTGETGAGKSIVIDSIGQLLGARSQRELIRSGADYALVSGVFYMTDAENLASLAELGVNPDEDGYIYVQRTIYADGRAQSKINGATVPVSLQREAGKLLVGIHGQHETQTLLDPARHLVCLDRFANTEEEQGDYRAAYDKMIHLKRELDSLEMDEREKQRRIDMLKFQLDDIDSVKLKPGEDDQLEAQRKKIKNIERIEKQVRVVYDALYRGDRGGESAYMLLDRASVALRKLSDVIENADELASQLDSFKYDVEDIAERVNDLLDDDIDDPTAALDKIETRLELITRLKRKYGATVDEIMAARDKYAKELADIEDSDETAKNIQKQLVLAEKEARQLADVLSQKRQEASKVLSERIMDTLKYLDMENCRFDIQVNAREMTRDGADDVSFMFSANPGEALRELSKTASGGELSRVMLAIKSVLRDSENTETVIYDEIDTGISGKTSHKIGVMLRKSSSVGQVLCVTHSPQIAALAKQHLKISKNVVDERTETNVKTLDRDEHIAEVARIMGGESITDTLLSTAREMVDYADSISI
ncbi:MAG: DNA repair protein RecN [Clostridia bacterium]|nr:DNA repair protein RecN [Clostridia bacterium]